MALGNFPSQNSWDRRYSIYSIRDSGERRAREISESLNTTARFDPTRSGKSPHRSWTGCAATNDSSNGLWVETVGTVARHVQSPRKSRIAAMRRRPRRERSAERHECLLNRRESAKRPGLASGLSRFRLHIPDLVGCGSTDFLVGIPAGEGGKARRVRGGAEPSLRKISSRYPQVSSWVSGTYWPCQPVLRSGPLTIVPVER